MRYVRYLVLLIFALPVSGFATDATPASKALKSNYDNEEGFAGPGSTVRLPEEDDEEK